MSEKKAKASVFFVIAIIAFICSCIIFSMTGGVSDWIGDTVYADNENSTDLGISEFMEQYDDYSDSSYSSSSYQSDDSSSKSDSSNFLKDLTKKDKDSSKSDSGSDSGSSSGSSSGSDSGSGKSDSPSNSAQSDSI